MHAYIHAYIHTYMHACIDTYIHAYIHTSRQTCTCIHRYIHTYSIHRDRQTDRQTGRPAGRQAGKQANPHIDIQTYIHARVKAHAEKCKQTRIIGLGMQGTHECPYIHVLKYVSSDVSCRHGGPGTVCALCFLGADTKYGPAQGFAAVTRGQSLSEV